MDSKSVRFAVVGCGRVSSVHFDGIKKAPNGVLAAVCDINEERAKKAAINNGLSCWYTCMDEMLEKENIDIVNICTPSGMHCEHTLKAAKAGKHVLCEKPLDISTDKINRMIKGCRDAGVLLGGIFQRRTELAVINTRKAVREGKLGNIILASASLKYHRSQEYYDSAEWRGTFEYDGGGALMNQGIHGIDMLQWMVGDIHSVRAICKTLARDIEGEDTAVAAITFKNGAIGTIEGATSVYPGQDTVFSIHGEKGTIVLGDKGFYQWEIQGSEESAPDAGEGFGGTNCAWASSNIHAIQIDDMARAVIEGREPMVNGEEAKKAVEVVLAIYESSKNDEGVIL